MDQTAVVLLDDADELRQVEALLAVHRLRMLHCIQVTDLERMLASSGKCLILLNLETDGVDDSLLRRMGRTHPQAPIIGISKRTYHPELEQALRSNLRAVVARPIDEDELNLCLRGVMDV
ncbi:hypothetical protein SAMN05660653_02637 [Desulfonatronum thiosulfatophilum]|uniref:Response regulatory domain-containing protein n=1 Tax=Desulfonatronum thiosulfatophilum TaxID=617002 RepID=A0A1G6E7B4_9BACT|nr:hypothetical protein [Desulfonatronum thiosulfatophilum]SDB53306.1 hypothetical protein SAMN05660653_02637 [Desulfonatronum thiosulfatophilum]